VYNKGFEYESVNIDLVFSSYQVVSPSIFLLLLSRAFVLAVETFCSSHWLFKKTDVVANKFWSSGVGAGDAGGMAASSSKFF